MRWKFWEKGPVDSKKTDAEQWADKARKAREELTLKEEVTAAAALVRITPLIDAAVNKGYMSCSVPNVDYMDLATTGGKALLKKRGFKIEYKFNHYVSTMGNGEISWGKE